MSFWFYAFTGAVGSWLTTFAVAAWDDWKIRKLLDENNAHLGAMIKMVMHYRKMFRKDLNQVRIEMKDGVYGWFEIRRLRSAEVRDAPALRE